MQRFLGLIVTAAAPAILGLVSLPAYAQSRAGSRAAYKPPVSKWDGHADISGIWQVRNNANDDLEPHSAALGIPASHGVIVDPADGKIPYLPAALAKKQENYKNRASADPVNKCYMSGVPRFIYMPFPIQILQTDKYVIVASEYAHGYRTIYTDGSQHLDGIDFWNGDSRGHWEGNTLVVDVADFNDQTWLDKAGDHHSDQLHVVERFTRTAPDVLTYEATITDPQTFSKPWTIRMPLYRHTEPNFRLLEYECQSFGDPKASQ